MDAYARGQVNAVLGVIDIGKILIMKNLMENIYYKDYD